MARKTCAQSKNDNPNWLEKIDLEVAERIVKNQVEVFLSGDPKIMRFEDSIISYGGVVGGYSCSVK